MLFTMYFLCNEIKQLGNQSIIAFISNMWNIIDVIPLILVTTSVVITFINPENALNALIWQRYLNSISSFFLWAKLFYFFRIFRSFSHMIKTMVTVLADMRYFNILLVFSIGAFAGTFVILSNNQSVEDQYLTGYSDALSMMFEWTLGNQDSSNFGPVGYEIQYFFYVLACLSLIIVMLNLLISIIGESNTAVTQAAQTSMYVEFAQLIIENMHLLSNDKCLKQLPAGVGNYLSTTELQIIRIQNDSIQE